MALRKMYLVQAERYDHSRPPSQPPPVKSRPGVKTKRVAKKGKPGKQHPHYKWVALRTKLLEADINDSDLINRIVDFLHKVLPQPVPHKATQCHLPTESRPKIKMLDIAETPQRSPIAQRPEVPSVDEASGSYEVSKRPPRSGREDAETSVYDDDVRGLYEVSIPYLNNMRFLDWMYGIPRDGKFLYDS